MAVQNSGEDRSVHFSVNSGVCLQVVLCLERCLGEDWLMGL